MDVYRGEPAVKDPRYNKAVAYMDKLKKDQESKKLPYIETEVLVERVLWGQGVKLHVTIFSVGITPASVKTTEQHIEIYKPSL
mmetsp:Transcript_14283/g.24310  ORF Transcript_14283/g.24310 Transcript_14283/m.24310 type:complete len:83 (-) Transcript_14283:40-288(-)